MKPKSVEDALARLAEQPDDVELLQQLGMLYLRDGQPEAARETYERALSVEPENPWTHMYLGNWCYHFEELREALKWFQRAAELLPTEAIAFTCQGDVYWEQGEFELAEEAYRTARHIDPEQPYTRQRLREWYLFKSGDV